MYNTYDEYIVNDDSCEDKVRSTFKVKLLI